MFKYLYPIAFLILTFIGNFNCGGSIAKDDCPPTYPNCQSSDTIRIYVEDSLPEEKQNAFVLATEKWSAATQGRVVFDVSFVPVSELKDDDTVKNTFYVFHRNPSNPGYIGFAHWTNKGAVIEIKPDLGMDLYGAVALHELGHALREPHYLGPNRSIMDPSLSKGFEITCQDITNFCATWGCDIPCKIE